MLLMHEDLARARMREMQAEARDLSTEVPSIPAATYKAG